MTNGNGLTPTPHLGVTHTLTRHAAEESTQEPSREPEERREKENLNYAPARGHRRTHVHSATARPVAHSTASQHTYKNERTLTPHHTTGDETSIYCCMPAETNTQVRACVCVAFLSSPVTSQSRSRRHSHCPSGSCVLTSPPLTSQRRRC